MNIEASPKSVPVNSALRLYEIYKSTEQLSLKHDSYFHVYERVLKKYVGQPIIFLEVGILNGGSLFMWRNYFGPHARIIGVDMNPAAKRWEQAGFEIFIGDQSDTTFWRDLFAKIGQIDVLLDDGGHTNVQQILTVNEAIPHVRDGGLIIVEDVHCSYLRNFGNPSKFSFTNFAKRIVDSINSRNPMVKGPTLSYRENIESVSFHESIVVFSIDSRLCFISKPTTNNGISVNAEDFRYEGKFARRLVDLERALSFLKSTPFFWRLLKLFPVFHALLARIESRKLRHLFY